MTPREPDRFEAATVDLICAVGDETPIAMARDEIAAALRQAADEALERAGQEYGAEDLANVKVYCRHVAQRLRELRSPAAVPAAGSGYVCWTCKREVPENAPCPFCTPPSEPVAPAPDVRGALVEAKDALEQIWAAIGDRLCGNGPLSKGYAQAVASKADAAAKRIRAALADGGED